MIVTQQKYTVSFREDTIAEWYIKVFPLVAVYIQKKGGNLEEAKEIFQESILIYYEKITFSGFNPEKADEAYLMGIAKNKWLKYQAKRRHYERLSHLDLAEEKTKEPIPQKVLFYLKQTGEKCMDLLQAFYYEKLTMTQLADRFGYKSERSATVQKYKCLEKVRDQVKNKSLNYEDFLS